MSKTTHLTGDPEGSPAPVSEPSTAFGWHPLDAYSGHKGAEEAVALCLIKDLGLFVTRAGERNQSHDIEVSGISRRRYRGDSLIVNPGLYEVKMLWRRSDRHAFDRRFKAGTRGERIYGRRDSSIKSFALSLEREIDSIIESNTHDPKGSSLEFVEQAHGFIDDAMARRHSKGFTRRLERLARASLLIPNLSQQARAVLDSTVQGHDIAQGFGDLEGIFIVAGPKYTLVTKAEMASMLSLDSASSEGPKIRLHGVIPLETTKARRKKSKK